MKTRDDKEEARGEERPGCLDKKEVRKGGKEEGEGGRKRKTRKKKMKMEERSRKKRRCMEGGIRDTERKPIRLKGMEKEREEKKGKQTWRQRERGGKIKSKGRE